MKRHASGRSELLLMEIIIVILFFSIASAICLQIFAKSHQMSEQTECLNLAVVQTDSIAAVLEQEEHPAQMLYKVYPSGSFFNGTIGLLSGTIYYDKTFQYCDESEAKFALLIQHLSDDQGVSTYRISFKELKRDLIYRRDVLVYQLQRKDVTS